MESLGRRLLVFFTVLTSIIYIIWRMFFTIPFHYGWFSLLFGLALFITEFIGFFEMVIHFSQLSNPVVPKRPNIEGKVYPDVDVFISTYNEPTELLYKTINACLHMEYPDLSKVHIYLCDDGHRDEMGELAKKMGVIHLVRDTHEHAKAGNLNYALSVSNSPYIVTFDADMMPRHDFLTACIPYFMGEETIGFLQTPQTFYNPDLFQYNLYSENRFPNEQDYFYRDVQVMRNASNTVIYGGTNTILSRAALEEIGGFYTGVITEDFATGMMIESKGYQCYAIDEAYASGMAPEDLKSLLKQRQRWARGCIQTGRKIHILFLKGFNFRQKLSYITSISYWYGSLKRLLYILSPILYAVFNVMVVKCTLLEILIFWLPMYILNNLTLRHLSGNIRNTRLTNVYETILFPGLLPSVILETLGISQKTFVVTKKDAEEKLKTNDGWYKFRQSLPILILLFFSILGMTLCIQNTFLQGTLMYVVIMFWLSVNIFNLIMSLFFMYGRRAHRQFERFDAEIDCTISYRNRIIRTKTTNISEKGLSVTLDFPEWIPSEDSVKIELTTERYRTSWCGKVANVMNIGEKWRYGFEVTEITDENQRRMLQIVYDREPTLPKEIEKGLSTVDDIMINIHQRSKIKRNYFSRKLPRLKLNTFINTEDGKRVLVKDFNYQYITVQLGSNEAIPDKLTLCENSIQLHCQLEDPTFSHGIFYRIVNLDELLSNSEFRYVLRSWMDDYQLEIDENESYHKKISKTLELPEILDELEYLQ
ncbi:glycosyltransferase [Scatolibacter rhodanostii]|uniref:glycosyltransferase n=1 Tax=Scatolibacter rhodanostii TaxID=2014781 RepID=UPI000C071283|nr:glycosyltransferase [Scatolibacter rhodanostii]